MKEIIQHFDAFSTSTDPSSEMYTTNLLIISKLTAPFYFFRKVYIYSGHDTTVAPILHTLGVFNGLAPPYASVILVELLDTNGLYVKISYHNDSSSSPYPLTIPGCDHLCPLDKFKGR